MTTEIENDIKTIKKVLSRKNRKWIEENGERCAERLEKTNFNDWLKGLRLSACRSGLVYCNKLDEALHAMRNSFPDEAAKKPWESDNLREMILYTLSDECGLVRKALGSSIYSV